MNRNKLDFVEELVLSVALSFGLDGLAGLFLGLSPIGINFTSITISLSAMVLVFAAVVFVRRIKQPQIETLCKQALTFCSEKSELVSFQVKRS